MSQPHLKYSVLAFAVMQALAAGASAQTMPEVVITGDQIARQRARQHRRLCRRAAAADAGLDQHHRPPADAGLRHPQQHRRDEARRQRQRFLQRGRLRREFLDPRLQPRQHLELPQGRHRDPGRHPDPARKQGAHRSAQGPGRPAGRRRRAGRHHQLRHQAPDQQRPAFGHAGSARARHAVRLGRPGRTLRRQALRLPHQRGRREAALLRQGRRRRAPVRLRRLRLADHAGRAAAARPRLPAQVAADRAGLPADPRRQPADRDLADHAAQRPAVGEAGGHQEHQRRPAFRVPHQRRLERHRQHEQALVQARRLHRLPLWLQQRGRRLLSGLLLERRLRRLRLPERRRKEIAVRRAGDGAG